MANIKMVVNESPAESDILFLRNKIIEFNKQQTKIDDDQWLFMLLKDEKDEIVGGLFGYTWGGHCEIIYLWISELLRGQGFGSKLLLAAEAEAINRGCHQIVLNTHSFQAPLFYQKHGFKIFGVIEDCPKGFQNYYLRKDLVFPQGTSGA